MIKILLYFPFLSFLAISENRTYTVEELCAYDEFCRFSFDDSGRVYPVKPEVRFIIANLHSQIVDAGTRYGVDPRAIAGAIAAENTLNVQLSDEIQGYLAQNGVNSIAGKTFSVGLGQLKPEAAMIGEQTIARIEGRPPRTASEVEEAMMNPVESVKLISGVIRNAQDVYQARGIDISGRPDILTTLYNLGDVDRRAREASPNTEPRSNYFGAFVANNMTEIQDTIGWSPDRGKYRPLYLNSNNYSMNRLNRGVNPLPLYSRPPSCSSQDQSTREAEVARGRTFSGFRQTGQITGQFTIIDQAIDCEMQRWVLVQTPEGANGWVKHYDLEQNAALVESGFFENGWFYQRQQRRTCENATNECREKISQITGTETTRTNGLMTVKVNAPEGVTPSIKDFYLECYENQLRTSTTGPSGSSQNNRYPGMTTLNGIILRQMRQKLEDRKKEILSKLNLTQWSQVPEDFRQVFEAMERQMNNSAPQTDSYSGRATVSIVNMQVFDEVLKLEPPQSAAAPAPGAPANARPAYFGDMTGYQGQTQSYSNYGQSPYDRMLEQIRYDWLWDQTRMRFQGAAAATNVTEIRQPLGPASAPRGIQAEEVSEMARSRAEMRSLIRNHETTCKNYPDSFTMRELQNVLGNRDAGYLLREYIPRLDDYCQFYDALTAGQDLSNFRNCNYGGCEVYFINPTRNPPELDRQYFPMDYIKQNKHLLNPRDVMRKLSDNYKREMSQYGITTGQSSGSGCSYDPLKTLEKIEELSKLDCVGSIFVPEGDLFNGAERKSIPKVSFRPMDTNDSYQLLFKSCPIDGYEEPVPEAETPRPSSNAQ